LFAIGVDPQSSKSKRSDKTGIVGCGVDEDDVGYVLDDLTGNLQSTRMGKQGC
jgi:phage terminase large subunit-like protein